MSKELKAVLVGAILCFIGASLIDLGVHASGLTLLGLGVLGVIGGPTAVNL